MKIATWNVNSIKARLPVVMGWLQTARPDVLLLQEIKCETEAFPRFEVESLGYQVAVLGQKTYNGVAILSQKPMTDIMEGLPGNEEDVQARYIEATIEGFRIASLYLPNGNPVGSEKYPYKLAWMARLEKRAIALLKSEKPVVLGGDFNVLPEDQDVYNPQDWLEDALFRPDTRQAFRKILHQGYTDAFRALHPHQKNAYTFWDYQAGSFQRDLGLRIDHFLLSPEAVDLMENCFIDPGPRAQEKASDHTPLVSVFKY